jgi:hypothetical protein
MTTAIDAVLAAEHVADLRRAAERRHPAPGDGAAVQPAPSVELRLVSADTSQAVRRLADLDDAPELTGQVLLGLIGGDAVAGLSLDDRRVVANPFVPTSEVVALLRLRSEHLSDAPARRRWPRIRRLRLA